MAPRHPPERTCIIPRRRRVGRLVSHLSRHAGPIPLASPSIASCPNQTGTANPPPTVFSEDEMESWRRDGWIILRNAATPAQCAALVRAIFDQLQQDPDVPASWYPCTWPPPNGRADHHDGFLQFASASHRKLQWELCLNERIYAAHAQLLGEHRLRVGVAGAYMKPPYIGGHTLSVEQTGPIEPPAEKIFHRRGGDIKVPGGAMAMHFDTSLDDIRRGQIDSDNMLQGNISLTDTPGNAGGTCLLPGFHHELLDWVSSFPPLQADADTWDTGVWSDDGTYTPGSKGGWPGRNAYKEWPHAFDKDGHPLAEPELLRLNAELAAAGRLQPHWVGNLNHISLTPFQRRIRSIPTQLGDLLIWHRGCPHGNGFNLSTRPRLAQFVNFSVTADDGDDHIGDAGTQRKVAARQAFEAAGSPSLTPLGRKLAGLLDWR